MSRSSSQAVSSTTPPVSAGRARRWLALVLVAGACCVPWLAHADQEAEARYPYDPACAWGRLANGRGMLHRCLTKDEAAALAASGPSPLGHQEKAGASKKPPRTEKSQPDADSSSANDAREDGARGEETPSDDSSKAPGAYSLEVGPIKAEQGEITVGALSKPVDRYRKCVDDQGGLEGSSGQVVVKFLVRGERSRAEGVEVVSFRGVSKEAADCVAYVVDRRRVGTPTVPLTGVTLTFRLERK